MRAGVRDVRFISACGSAGTSQSRRGSGRQAQRVDETGVEIVVESARETGERRATSSAGRTTVRRTRGGGDGRERRKVAEAKVVKTHGARDVVVDGAKVRLIESRAAPARGGGDDVDAYGYSEARGDDAPKRDARNTRERAPSYDRKVLDAFRAATEGGSLVVGAAERRALFGALSDGRATRHAEGRREGEKRRHERRAGHRPEYVMERFEWTDEAKAPRSRSDCRDGGDQDKEVSLYHSLLESPASY